MHETTMRVSRANRDEVKTIAEEHGVTIDQALSLLLRRFRQQEMGEALAAAPLDKADRAVLDAGAATVARG
ncbi:MAG: hypothetical protein ACR2H3_09280 [Acidimicrobiales bacterium]